MTGHTLAAVIVLGGFAAGVGVVGLTRPVPPPPPPPACAEGTFWVRHAAGEASQMAGVSWCREGQRVEIHEHASGAVYAVCRCSPPPAAPGRE